MEQDMKPDLVINGVSTAGGGEYAKVRIDGVGTVEGDVATERFDCNGMTKIRGRLHADSADIDGMFTIEGNLSARSATVDGHAKVKGSVKADGLAVNGLLNVAGDCEIEHLRLEGAFDVRGLLNAGELSVMLHGKGKAREIGVESIRVRRKSRGPWGKLLTWIIPHYSPELETYSIEGDDIDLEYTEATAVRGNRVIVGKGCKIDLVEYRTELYVHPSAKIGKEVKTDG
ncbi:polymer-forming cytoskeletal protein [Paenibacillaceae bacterium WGS1546]|uniref:polymer-forming cytoskeletal protein n=1 Tax=Cohnella sp. WGS1546 TaxID=3366810 RepID=UPI00372D6E40